MNPDCELYGQAKKENLIIRKTYGQPDMRYLHCREEFSERKNTPLWNGQIEEQKAVSFCEHLNEESNSAFATGWPQHSAAIEPAKMRMQIWGN